ncbi:MAG: ORF6N domain-containing protein [Flavobacteriia bacterium]|jgi:hypothetical protein
MELQQIQHHIYEIRGMKVMLDYDLARLYEVETRVLNQAVKRNIDIFPIDFMFKLNEIEWKEMSSQIVMTSPSKRPKTALPLVFTEHGVAMLANVLKSEKARKTSVSIIRAFIAIKQFTINYLEISNKLKELENKYDKQFADVFEAINFLIQKDKKVTIQTQRKKIGFKSESE